MADVSSPEWDRNPVLASGNPLVSIIVPARNEEETLNRRYGALLALDYDNYEVIAVNDRSTDRTGEIMERVSHDPHLSRKTALSGPPSTLRFFASFITLNCLPVGWGRLMRCGLQRIRHQASGCCLLMPTFCSSPIRCDGRWLMPRLEPADHVVLFPRMIMKRPGEYMMIAFFQTMFMFGHRPWKVADPSTDDHMGVGAFNLVRRRVYDAVGTYEALRMEVLDDMKLGKVVKKRDSRSAMCSVAI